jgi:hypothetical protein
MEKPQSIHPEMQLLISARAGVPTGDTLAEARAAWTAYSAALAQPRPTNMEVHDRAVPSGDHQVPVRI